MDAEARIQERIEELQRAREEARRPPVVNPEQKRKLESLKLVHKELSRQIEAATHPARRLSSRQRSMTSAGKSHKSKRMRLVELFCMSRNAATD